MTDTNVIARNSKEVIEKTLQKLEEMENLGKTKKSKSVFFMRTMEHGNDGNGLTQRKEETLVMKVVEPPAYWRIIHRYNNLYIENIISVIRENNGVTQLLSEKKTEVHCLAHYARRRGYKVTTDASRTGMEQLSVRNGMKN